MYISKIITVFRLHFYYNLTILTIVIQFLLKQNVYRKYNKKRFLYLNTYSKWKKLIDLLTL